MRLFSFVLAILVLVLSSVACSDVHAASGGVTTIMEAPAHHQDAGHTDCCSPFCQCACCAGAIVPQSIAALPEPQAPTFIERVYTSHPSATLSQRAVPIWQPPQLG